MGANHRPQFTIIGEFCVTTPKPDISGYFYGVSKISNMPIN